MIDDDRDLHARFAAQRREDASVVRPFGAVLARRRAPASLFRRNAMLVAAAASLAAVALGVHFIGRRPRPPLVDLAAVRWVAPTDFLLQLPGSELLRTVPSFTPVVSDTDRRTP